MSVLCPVSFLIFDVRKVILGESESVVTGMEGRVAGMEGRVAGMEGRVRVKWTLPSVLGGDGEGGDADDGDDDDGDE